MSATLATPKKLKWVERWLEVFRDTGNVRLACHACRIERSTAYRLRERDPEFARRWAEAEEDAVDVLEAEARKRARNSSDTLLIFLLKAHRPGKYRETTRHDIVFGRMTDDELDAYIARRLAESGPGSEDRDGAPALSEGEGEGADE